MARRSGQGGSVRRETPSARPDVTAARVVLNGQMMTLGEALARLEQVKAQWERRGDETQGRTDPAAVAAGEGHA